MVLKIFVMELYYGIVLKYTRKLKLNTLASDYCKSLQLCLRRSMTCTLIEDFRNMEYGVLSKISTEA